MKKKYCIYKKPWGDIEAWEYIDDLEEAMSYWYIRMSIDKYGVEGTMPVCIISSGHQSALPLSSPILGLHSLRIMNCSKVLSIMRGSTMVGLTILAILILVSIWDMPL